MTDHIAGGDKEMMERAEEFFENWDLMACPDEAEETIAKLAKEYSTIFEEGRQAGLEEAYKICLDPYNSVKKYTRSVLNFGDTVGIVGVRLGNAIRSIAGKGE